MVIPFHYHASFANDSQIVVDRRGRRTLRLDRRRRFESGGFWNSFGFLFFLNRPRSGTDDVRTLVTKYTFIRFSDGRGGACDLLIAFSRAALYRIRTDRTNVVFLRVIRRVDVIEPARRRLSVSLLSESVIIIIYQYGVISETFATRNGGMQSDTCVITSLIIRLLVILIFPLFFCLPPLVIASRRLWRRT